ncbi:MAG: class I SAM-dependent methyltransferase [Acidobacteriota bacterium]|nr:class I SAM-dependent methyltransferase [Acidobacteriota bacterium]
MAANIEQLEPALVQLLNLYYSRPDLEDAYPEVHERDFQRLINWAAAASADVIKDSGRPLLSPFAEWFQQHAFAVTPDVRWPTIRKTAEAAANGQAISLPLYENTAENDISEHLPIFFLLVREFRLKRIVELGTRSGNSTLVLLEAAKHIGGTVLSMDVEPCHEARQRIRAAGLEAFWTFWLANDLEVLSSEIPKPIDLLFIDTLQTYGQMKLELAKYGPMLRPGGWIVIHDYVAFSGITEAVQEYVALHKNQLTF